MPVSTCFVTWALSKKNIEEVNACESQARRGSVAGRALPRRRAALQIESVVF